MADLEAPGRKTHTASGTHALSPGTLTAAALAVCLAQVEAAVYAVASGPLGANAVPATVPLPGGKTAPFNPLEDVAFHALSHAYSIGYLICGIAALLAALLALLVLGGRMHDTLLDPQTLAEE